MDQNEFFRLFKFLHNVGWKMATRAPVCGGIRVDSVAIPRSEEFPLDPSREPRFCPITAVCLLKTGNCFIPDEWQEAARVMGLSRRNALLVKSASDKEVGCRRDIQIRLLEVFGYSESLLAPPRF